MVKESNLSAMISGCWGRQLEKAVDKLISLTKLTAAAESTAPWSNEGGTRAERCCDRCCWVVRRSLVGADCCFTLPLLSLLLLLAAGSTAQSCHCPLTADQQSAAC